MPLVGPPFGSDSDLRSAHGSILSRVGVGGNTNFTDGILVGGEKHAPRAPFGIPHVDAIQSKVAFVFPPP